MSSCMQYPDRPHSAEKGVHEHFVVHDIKLNHSIVRQHLKLPCGPDCATSEAWHQPHSLVSPRPLQKVLQAVNLSPVTACSKFSGNVTTATSYAL
jgi:hypothetical protein